MATLSPFLGKSTPLPAERTVLVTPIVLEFAIAVKEGKIEGKLQVGDGEEEKTGSCFLKNEGLSKPCPTFSPSGGRGLFRRHRDVMDLSCLATDNRLSESESYGLEHPMNFNLTKAAIAGSPWMVCEAVTPEGLKEGQIARTPGKRIRELTCY